VSGEQLQPERPEEEEACEYREEEEQRVPASRGEEPPTPPQPEQPAADALGAGPGPEDAGSREAAPPPLKDAPQGQEFRGSEYDEWMNDFMAKYVHRALIGVSELFSSETEDIERLFKPNQLPTLAPEENVAGPRLAQVETY